MKSFNCCKEKTKIKKKRISCWFIIRTTSSNGPEEDKRKRKQSLNGYKSQFHVKKKTKKQANDGR